jgi:hypothetical protein
MRENRIIIEKDYHHHQIQLTLEMLQVIYQGKDLQFVYHNGDHKKLITLYSPFEGVFMSHEELSYMRQVAHETAKHKILNIIENRCKTKRTLKRVILEMREGV